MRIKCINYVNISFDGVSYEMKEGDEETVSNITGKHLLFKSKGKLVEVVGKKTEVVEKPVETPKVESKPIESSDKPESSRENRFKSARREKAEKVNEVIDKRKVVA